MRQEAAWGGFQACLLVLQGARAPCWGLAAVMGGSGGWHAVFDSLLCHQIIGKLAGLDKKLSRSLEEEVMESSSPSELSKSPVGPLVDSNRCTGAAVRVA